MSGITLPWVHIYTAISCDGPIMLCQEEPSGLLLAGHSQAAYLYHVGRGSDMRYCPECSDAVPEGSKDLMRLKNINLLG